MSDSASQPDSSEFVNKLAKKIEGISDTKGIKKIILDSPDSTAEMLHGVVSARAGDFVKKISGVPVQGFELPEEVRNLMEQMIQTQPKIVPENTVAGTDLIRKVPEEVESALNQAEFEKNNFIDVNNCSLFGVSVNFSKRDDVKAKMNEISKFIYEEDNKDLIYYYSDAGVNFYFDENDLVNEIEVDSKYKYQTTKGLKVGDPLETAISLYGLPRMKSAKGAIWDKFSVLLHDRSDEIRLIRLKVRG